MGCLLPWFPPSVQTPLSQEHTLFADSLGLEWRKFKIHEWGLYKLRSINKLILTNFMVKCMYTAFACFLINHKTEKLVNELEFVHPFANITLTRSPVTMQFDFYSEFWLDLSSRVQVILHLYRYQGFDCYSNYQGTENVTWAHKLKITRHLACHIVTHVTLAVKGLWCHTVIVIIKKYWSSSMVNPKHKGLSFLWTWWQVCFTIDVGNIW